MMYDVSAQGVDERMINVHYDDDGVRIQDFRGQSEEAILFTHIPKSRGLVLGETKSPYLLNMPTFR